MSAMMPPDLPQNLGKDSKRSLHNNPENGPPQKKRRQLLELSDSSEDEIISVNDLEELADGDFRVNEEFARRFEHNKKREELTKLQEKYGSSATNLITGDHRKALEDNPDELSSDSSSDEDDDGELALGALDEQVQSTLEAIRKKDPRVYDTSVKFYTDPDEENPDSGASKDKRQKPMYINDYHRKNLLEGEANGEDEKGGPLTYQEEQDDLKSSIIKEMHAAIVDPSSEDDKSDSIEDGFLIKKANAVSDTIVGKDPTPRQVPLDVEAAEENPEAFLSKFMSTRAWVSGKNSQLQPFESDDEEEEHRAEAFEEAYNLRFENPNASNEKLRSHARDTAARYSVRKDELNPRKKKRDVERSRKDEEKQLRLEERARLRKLRVAELEEKVNMIKEAAGLENENLPEHDWSALLDDAWDDEKWASAMESRFGDDYYNGQSLGDRNGGQDPKAGKMKKPRWKDEIEISDIIADFDDTERADANGMHSLMDNNIEVGDRKEEDPKKSSLDSGRDKKKLERLERQKIAQVVDGHLAVNESLAKSGKKHAGFFRYRETSPISHGLTANDILMADDSQLNQFAGLKKLATFRDPDKKRKDKKYLGKKQRLKQWRKETFGDAHGPTKTLAEVLPSQDQIIDQSPQGRLGAHQSKRESGNKARIRKDKKKALKMQA